MKILAYPVVDPIEALYNVGAGLPIEEKLWYVKIGEHGLLEDYLSRKGFVFYKPEEIEVADDFSSFAILVITHDKSIIDLANGQVIVKSRVLEPSLN